MGSDLRLKLIGDETDDDEEPTRPPTNEYTQLPIASFNEWDKVGQIRNILHSLRTGYFRDPALLVDQMFEDDRIAGDMSTRCQGLLGVPFEMKPGRENRKGLQIAKCAQLGFSAMVSAAALSDLMRWGLMSGIGVGELVWDLTGDFWVPRLKIWHTQFVYWNWATRSYWLITQEDASIELPRTDKDIHSDGKWVLYTPYGYQNGWLRCLLRALCMPWLSRQWAHRDWNRSNEVHGVAIRKAIVPGNAEKGAKSRFANSVATLGSESVIVCPQVQDPGSGDRYDVDLLELDGDTWEGFDKLLERCDKAISIVILGQDSSNRAQGGSLASAKENIRDDVKRFDAKTIDEVIRQQLLHWWTLYNYGDTKLTPFPEHDVEPAEEEKDEAKALSDLSTSLPNLHAAGADVREVLDHFGIPLREDEEQEPAFGPQPGGPGQPPGSPAPDAEKEQPAVAASDRVTLSTAATPRPAYGKKRAKLYQDRLTAKARARAAKAIEVDLKDVREDIAAASSFIDLKARLVRRFKDMDPTALAKVVERARIMAELEGRHAVLRKL